MCAIVGELVVGGRELLKALEGDGVEVSAEFRVLRENHSSPRHERVDQRLLPHRSIECGVGRVLDLVQIKEESENNELYINRRRKRVLLFL